MFTSKLPRETAYVLEIDAAVFPGHGIQLYFKTLFLIYRFIFLGATDFRHFINETIFERAQTHIFIDD